MAKFWIIGFFGSVVLATVLFGTYIGAVFGLLSALTFFGILFSVFTWGGDYYDDYD